jgi:hypothetical protein
MSLMGQSRRMRPACFSSECPLLPGSDSLATKVRCVVKVESRMGAVT